VELGNLRNLWGIIRRVKRAFITHSRYSRYSDAGVIALIGSRTADEKGDKKLISTESKKA